MTLKLAGGVAIAAAAFLHLCATPATAQKAKDTLRFPLLETESTLDGYLTVGWFHQVWGRAVYDTLIGFNPVVGKFEPQLATSWSQPTPTTYEFVLRDDIKWHDGTAFTADDAVYTMGWLIDPKTQFRFKSDWAWVQSVEKLGDHKIRITSKFPSPAGLMTLAGGNIYPEHVHKPLENKADFGAKPVGTGLYKVLKLDKNTGITAERNPNYKPSAGKPAAAIGHVIAEPIMDPGTLVAALLTGKADIASNLSGDQAEDLQKSGNYDVTLSPPAVGYTFLGFPAGGRQNVKALADPRVRKAIAMAIDRQALVKVTYGAVAGKGVTPVDGLCLKQQLGCGFTEAVPNYDPAGAKRLLAEAGYADGFDVTIATFPRYLQPATAVSGMLRAVGIRATVQPHPIANRVQMLKDNRIDMSYYSWSGGNQFEVSGNIGRHFSSKDYADEPLQQAADKTLSIMDDTERRAAVAKVFDEVSNKAYAFAMLPNRFIYTHTKEVALVNPDEVREMDIIGVHEWRWK